MKNDTTFVRIRSGDHLGNTKMSKEAHRSIEVFFFINCDRQKRFLQNERRIADLQKVPQIFSFLPRDVVIIFQSLVTLILPRFFDFERPYLSP